MTLWSTLDRRFRETAGIPPLVSGDDYRLADAPLTDAAVLAAVVDRAEPALLLTRRDERLRKHPGQVAMPGGRADPGDPGPVATALREAQEEIALPPDSVAVIGTDDAYRTGSGFSIVPVVGVVPPDLPLRPQEVEVAEIFEVPLAFLLDPLNRMERETDFNGARRRYYEFLYDRHRIWGVTAALILNLARRIGHG